MSMVVTFCAALEDTTVLLGRSMRHTLRNIEAMITAIVLPVVLLLLFVYLFGGAIRSGAPHYVDYVVPGIILLCAGFGSAMTAVSVADDLRTGIVDRFRCMDVARPALLAAHVVASLARNVMSLLIIVGVSFAIGFRTQASPVQWLAAIGVLLAFMFALSWLSAAIGVLAETPEGANGFAFAIMFLPYVSSAFVPIDTMPAFLQPIARHQPVTPVIETVRGLLTGSPIGNQWWIAIAWCTGIFLVFSLLAGALFRRRTSH